jgi:penicillin amidase
VTGYRARRIREQLERNPRLDRDAHRRLQLDVYSGRAAKCVPALIAILSGRREERIQQAVGKLHDWDFHARSDSIAAAVFSVFFTHWCRGIASERVPAESVELVASAAGPLAVRLLCHDDPGWFVSRQRDEVVGTAFQSALDELRNRLGDDIEQWRWGRLHQLAQRHFLSGRGDLGQLLDHPRLEMDGDAHSVNSAVPDASYTVWLGAGYRFIAELADPRAGWWSIEVGGASGHPGSPHYSDQLSRWRAGELYYTPLRGTLEGQTLTLVASARQPREV